MTKKNVLRRAVVLATATTAALGTAACGLTSQGGTPATVTAAAVAATTTTQPTPTTTTTSPPAAAVAPNQTVIVVPQGSPSTVTQYETVPPVYGSGYGSGSYSDSDFLARLNARGIVTPGAATRAAGGRNVCYQLAMGSTLTIEANKLLDAPYDYWNALAGYFVGEAVKVYCPRYSFMLTS